MLSRVKRFRGEHTHNEVIQADHYRIRGLPFEPDVFYDIGANRGIFAMWARHCFPGAKLVCLEPEPDNFRVLTEVCAGLDGVHCIHGGLGNGLLYFRRGADPGKHLFTSGGVGYPVAQMANSPSMQPSAVAAVTLADLVAKFGGKRYAVKIDIESAEVALIEDGPAREVLRRAEYVAMELHFWAMSQSDTEASMVARLRWIGGFRHTHDIQMELWRAGGMAWLFKRRP